MKSEKAKLIESVKADLLADPIEARAPVYQPIYFEEFGDIQTSLNKSAFLKKFNLIFRYIDEDLTNKTVLDVGSNAGYFSFAAAERNALVDALEPIPRYFELCSTLQNIYGISNIHFNNDPLTTEFLNKKKYDYCFFLSVFQWISEGNSKLDHAKNVLMELSRHVSTLFFELGCNSGKSAVRTSRINHCAYIYSLLKDSTEFRFIKLIGTTNLWGIRSNRYIFICSKKNLYIKEPFYAFLKHIPV
jgi:hypothetical protein